MSSGQILLLSALALPALIGVMVKLENAVAERRSLKERTASTLARS